MQLNGQTANTATRSKLWHRAGEWLQQRTGTARSMRVVETLALGNRRSLVLVECEGKRYLVASGEGLSAPVAISSTADGGPL